MVFTLESIMQTVVNGLMIGCIFSLVAAGLTLIWGVVGLVNWAHAEFMMLSMYSAYWLYTLFRIDPLFSLPLDVILMFAFGVLVYRLLISKTLDAPSAAQNLATFGLMIFLRGGAQFLWTPNYRSVGETLVKGNARILGAYTGVPQLVAAGGAVLTTAFLYWFVERTKTGRALAAVAEDNEAAALMGINRKQMYTLALGIGAACSGVAGGLLSTYYYIYPDVGVIFGMMALITVSLGGFGSIPGAFLGGLVAGLVMVFGGALLSPAFKYAAVFVVYLLVVSIRPQGLMGEA
jgi:branched-chain amino acid transport system permease protein